MVLCDCDLFVRDRKDDLVFVFWSNIPESLVVLLVFLNDFKVPRLFLLSAGKFLFFKIEKQFNVDLGEITFLLSEIIQA